MGDKVALFDVCFELSEFMGGSLLVVNGDKRETVRLYLLEVGAALSSQGVACEERHSQWPAYGRGYSCILVWAAVPRVFDVCAKVKFGKSWRHKVDVFGI